ncbi:hypothetical protein DM02DRAFT_623475 [Periconia macrospinosa]|uniref:Uncharacterized protein n=1 Tax=Periconia macrospinosa TaxID=97972 RepID=A0A2V1E6F5_9PLEO|nr:hypothetical protein DM02DRAFT_623475 [Periconia macrospinosa]
MGFFRKAGEVTNLITDRRYKEQAITSLEDPELVAAWRSTLRMKSASATGITLNSGVSIANPFFVGAAVLNTHQFTVCYVNRKRVKEEVKRRKKESKEFAKWFEEQAESKGNKDILVGSSIKTVFTGLSMGLVGFDTIGNNFTELFTGEVPAAPAPSGGTAAGNVTEHVTEHTSPGFNADHSTIAAIEEGRFEAYNFLTDPLNDAANAIAEGHPIETDTTWAQVGQFHDNGFSAGTLAGQIASVGAGSEMLQLPNVVGEAAIDHALKHHHEKQANYSYSKQRMWGEGGGNNYW